MNLEVTGIDRVRKEVRRSKVPIRGKTLEAFRASRKLHYQEEE